LRCFRSLTWSKPALILSLSSWLLNSPCLTHRPHRITHQNSRFPPIPGEFSLVDHAKVFDIFDSVALPSSREIDYHWPHRSSVRPPLVLLLRKQGHTITTFDHNIELFSEENFRSCLRCCPHLEKLLIVELRPQAPKYVVKRAREP